MQIGDRVKIIACDDVPAIIGRKGTLLYDRGDNETKEWSVLIDAVDRLQYVLHESELEVLPQPW